jgi:hypothetical protein
MNLNRPKLDALSDISQDIGQIFFASAFINPLTAHEVNWALACLGFGFALVFWSLKVKLTK